MSGRLKNDRTFTCDESKTEKPGRGAFTLREPRFFLKLMEKDLNLNIITRGETIYVSGDDESFQIADRLLGSLLALIRKGIEISERDVIYAIKMAKKNELEYFESMYEEEITKTQKANQSV